MYIDVENVLHHQVAAYLDRIDHLCDEHLWGYELGVKGMMLSFSVGHRQNIPHLNGAVTGQL